MSSRGLRRAAVTLLLLAVACPLVAESLRTVTGAYAFKNVVDSRGPFERLLPSPAINAAGVVVFKARLSGEGEGIFAVAPSQPSPVTLADTRTDFGRFGSVPSINEAGTVVFFAGYKTGGPTSACAVSFRGGPLTSVAPTSGAHSSTEGGMAGVNDAGKVAFFATGDDGSSGIYLGTGQGAPVMSIVDNRGAFHTFGPSPVLDDAGRVVFGANLRNGGWGLYAVERPGALPVLLLADHTRNFLHVDTPVIGGQDRVIFHGVQSDGNEGIYILSRAGGPVATAADGRRGGYHGFFGVTANAAGTIAFSALRGTGGYGIYTGTDPRRDRVVVPGDPLFGSTIDRAILAGRGINQRGEIAFFYALADERTGIAVALPSRWGAWTKTVEAILITSGAGATLLFALGYLVKARG